MAEGETPQAPAGAGTIGDVGLEVGAALADEVVADVSGAIPRKPALRGLASTLDRAQRHPQLRFSGGLGQLLDRLAVAVAAQEVHARVGPGRVALQLALDQADRLEVLTPVEGCAQPEARDGVGDGDLGRGLALVLTPDRVLGRHLLGGEVGVDGGADGGKAGAVLAQALEHLKDVTGVEVLGQGRRPPVAGLVDPGHVGVGRTDGLAGLERLLREPPQVLDEGQLQHAGPGPQLADGQRRHRLVAVHEAHELLPVQAAVAVTDQLHRHGVDAGVARELARGELGQLAIVAVREVPANVQDLGGHEMEVVEEPFRGGGDELPPVHVVGHGDIGLAQDAGVVVEARQDVPRRPPGVRVEGEPGGEGLRPLFQSFDAQQLVAQGLLALRPWAAPEQTEHCFQMSSSRSGLSGHGLGRASARGPKVQFTAGAIRGGPPDRWPVR